MRKLVVTWFSLTTLVAAAFAGPLESLIKEVQGQTAPPPREFYRDREWSVDLLGAYAFSGNSYRADRYLKTDHAWGGGLDANYFFTRYFGASLEGDARDANDVLGQASANLAFRYPIPGTRFAPYGYTGGGVIFNGSHAEDVVANGGSVASPRRRSDAEAVGQVGAGVEFRITPHIGIINDFSWSVVDGPDNSFGMVRSGLRFTF